jgi:hypothetical protein
VISPALLVVLALGTLSASVALLAARLELFVAADVFAIGAALLGLAAFVTVGWSTIRRARSVSRR